MLHQKARSVKVGSLSDADKKKYGLVGVADSEWVAITITDDQPAPVVTAPPMVPPEPESTEQAG